MRVSVVGCGGIGYYLAEGIARLMAKRDEPSTMYLVDGDVIEEKNLERQFFRGVVGKHKAAALANLIGERFGGDKLMVVPVTDYLNQGSLAYHRKTWLNDGIIIMSCVDNNATRVFLEKHFVDFVSDGTLIDGGNDDVRGQAQIVVRIGGRNVTPLISETDPEILVDAGEPLPSIDHCLENSVSEPQTAQVNKAVALAMELLFELAGTTPSINEIRVAIHPPSMRGVHKPKVRTKGATKPCCQNSSQSGESKTRSSGTTTTSRSTSRKSRSRSGKSATATVTTSESTQP